MQRPTRSASESSWLRTLRRSNMSKQLAAFSTTRERPSIKIDGVTYELLEPDDIKLKEALWMEKASRRIDALMKLMQEDENAEATEELADLIFRVTDILMREVPEKVKARLTDIQKLSIIRAYMDALAARREVASRPLADGEDGKPSSQNSSTSTEETQQHGST